MLGVINSSWPRDTTFFSMYLSLISALTEWLCWWCLSTLMELEWEWILSLDSLFLRNWRSENLLSGLTFEKGWANGSFADKKAYTALWVNGSLWYLGELLAGGLMIIYFFSNLNIARLCVIQNRIDVGIMSEQISWIYWWQSDSRWWVYTNSRWVLGETNHQGVGRVGYPYDLYIYNCITTFHVGVTPLIGFANLTPHHLIVLLEEVDGVIVVALEQHQRLTQSIALLLHPRQLGLAHHDPRGQLVQDGFLFVGKVGHVEFAPRREQIFVLLRGINLQSESRLDDDMIDPNIT